MSDKIQTQIDEIIQLMRTLNMAQIRKQLEHDHKMHYLSEFRDRFSNVADFFRAAKEQQK